MPQLFRERRSGIICCHGIYRQLREIGQLFGAIFTGTTAAEG